MGRMEPASPGRISTSVKQYLLLGLILVMGVALRVNRSGFECLTFDEQWHMELSAGRGSMHEMLPENELVPQAPELTRGGHVPWYGLWTRITGAVHPPLYFMVLRVWRGMFGWDDAPARALSILCSLIAIVLTYEAGRRLVGDWCALGAAALLAVAPNQVYIAQQVRGYAMLQMLGAMTLLAAASVETSVRPRVWGIAMVALGVLGMMLTHYFAAGAAIGIGVWAMHQLRGKARAQALAVLALAAVVYAMIWLPWAWDQRSEVTVADRWLKDDRSHARLSTVARLAAAPGHLVVSEGPRFIDRITNRPWMMVSGVLLVLPPFFFRRKPGMVLWYCWLVGTLAFLAGLDLVRSSAHLRFPRYLTLAAPGAFLLFTSLLSLMPAWLGRALLGVTLIGSLAASGSIYVEEERNWRGIGEFLNRYASDGEAIIVHPGDAPRGFHHWYLLAASHYSNHFPAPVLKLTARATPVLLGTVPGATAWLITSEPGPDASEILPGVTVLEKYDVPTLASAIRVRLPQTPTTAPLQTGSSGP